MHWLQLADAKLALGLGLSTLMGWVATATAGADWPNALVIQGGALGILGLSVWWTLAKLIPRFLDSVFTTHRAQVEQLQKQNDQYHIRLEGLAGEIRGMTVAVSENMQANTDSIRELVHELQSRPCQKGAQS